MSTFVQYRLEHDKVKDKGKLTRKLIAKSVLPKWLLKKSHRLEQLTFKLDLYLMFAMLFSMFAKHCNEIIQIVLRLITVSRQSTACELKPLLFFPTVK